MYGSKIKKYIIGDNVHFAIPTGSAGQQKLKGVKKMSKNTAAIDAAKRKEKRNSILITISVILVAVLVIGLVVYNSLSTNGFITRRQVAMATENFSVNGSMMNYFFRLNYNQNASQYTAYGLNTNYTLKSQVIDETSGYTWFDQFASMSVSYVQEILAMCEGAKANGITLDEADYAEIDATMETMRATAESYGYSMEAYLLNMFGSVVNEDDIRDCVELNTLALKYYNQFSEGLSYTDADLEAYYEEHKEDYQCVDVITYTVKQSDMLKVDEEGNPVGNVTEGAALAKAQAELIAAAKTEEEFRAALKDHFVTNLLMTEEEADAKVEQCYFTGMTATSGNEASDWAFSAEVGDTTVTGAATSSSYDVYYLLKAPYRDESTTRNVRHILLTSDTYGAEAEAKAKEVYAEWEASGFAMDVYTTLCTEYSEDPGSVEVGGVYENVAEGEMITEFNDWLFDEARVVGDNGLVETSYGWHIMYYDGEGNPVWMTDAESALRSEAYSEQMAMYGEGIEVNQDVVYSINA